MEKTVTCISYNAYLFFAPRNPKVFFWFTKRKLHCTHAVVGEATSGNGKHYLHLLNKKKSMNGGHLRGGLKKGGSGGICAEWEMSNRKRQQKTASYETEASLKDQTAKSRPRSRCGKKKVNEKWKKIYEERGKGAKKKKFSRRKGFGAGKTIWGKTKWQQPGKQLSNAHKCCASKHRHFHIISLLLLFCFSTRFVVAPSQQKCMYKTNKKSCIMLMWRCAWADHRNHCQTEQLSHKTLKAFNYFPQTKR